MNDNLGEELAVEFLQYRNDSLKDLIKMGGVLVNAKFKLEKGEFHHWLKDSRVNVSLRTAQRLMTAFRNFRHLLDKDVSLLLTELDISHLLELKNVPQRFKKSIEIEEKGKTILVDVVDEDKVQGFLNKPVEVDGYVSKIKELPLKQFKQQIREVGGEYKDLVVDGGDKGTVAITGDCPEGAPIVTKKTGYVLLFDGISTLISQANNVREQIDAIDTTTVYEMTQDDKVSLLKYFSSLKDVATTIIVKIGDKEGVLQ